MFLIRVYLYTYIFFSSFGFKGDIDRIISSHTWKLASIETFKGIKIPTPKSQILTSINEAPVCGQEITFKKNHSCQVDNRGHGPLSQLDVYSWHLTSDKNLILEKLGDKKDRIVMKVYIANSDSLILFIPAKSIETGNNVITVYKLYNLKPSN